MKNIFIDLKVILFLLLFSNVIWAKDTSVVRYAAGESLDMLEAVHSLAVAPKTLKNRDLLYFNLRCKGACKLADLDTVHFVLSTARDQNGELTFFENFTVTHIHASEDRFLLEGYFEDGLLAEKRRLSLLLEGSGRNITYRIQSDIFAETLKGEIFSGNFKQQDVVDCIDGKCASGMSGTYHCTCQCSFCTGFASACESEYIQGGLSTEPDGTLTCTVQ